MDANTYCGVLYVLGIWILSACDAYENMNKHV